MDVYRYNCAVIFADKLKLRTVAQVFQKFGRLLILKNNLGKIMACLDAWPYCLKTKSKFNANNFQTNLGSLAQKIDGYSVYF